MSFFKSLNGPPQRKQSGLAFARAYGAKGQPYTTNWNVTRAVQAGMLMNVWVFRSVHAIAQNAAGLPFQVRKDNPWNGTPLETHPLLPRMNFKPNDSQDAWAWRYQLSCQVLLNKMGAYIEVVRSRRGDPIALYLFQPNTIRPIPDETGKKLVSGYLVQVPGEQPKTIDPNDVVWIKLPHPTDPYSGMTPLEAAGLAVEADILAKQFNRNFLMNDGRPGGILAIKGGIEDEDAEILRNRFLGPALNGGPQGAGRLTVLETGDGGVDFVDTATTPRDAQYSEMRKSLKEEILIAFGTPEAVIGNASGRTYDNAGVETEVFWRETMLPHLNLIARPLDILTGDNQFAGFDTSSIYILDRDKREQHKYYLEELKAGAISVDTYLEKTGQDQIGDDHRYILNNMVPYGPDGKPDFDAPAAIQPPRPGLAPAPPTGEGGPGGDGPKPATQHAVDDNGNGQHPAPAPAKTSWVIGNDGWPELRLVPTDAKAIAVPEPAALPPARLSWGRWSVMPDDLKAHKGRMERRMSSWERLVKRQMVGYFERQGRVVVEKLRSRKTAEKWTQRKALDVSEVFDRRRWDDELADDADGWMNQVYGDFGGEVAAALHDEFDMTAPAVRKAMAAQRTRVLKVNATTEAEVAAAIAAAQKEGIDAGQLVQKIGGLFVAYAVGRAAATALTETVAASSAAIVLAGEQSSTTVTKVWTSMGDEKVRDAHDEADGQEVAVDEDFDVGGEAMAFPGDPRASADNTINCRCSVTLATDEGPIGLG